MINQKGFLIPFWAALILIFVVGLGAFYIGKSSTKPPISDDKQNSKSSVPSVPQFSSGRIAFLKGDGNVYMAKSDGETNQITKDAAKKISENFNYPLQYRNPIWSPDGDKFAFEQILNYTEKAYILISDGKETSAKYPAVLKVYWNLPPFWYKNDKITIPHETITTSTLALVEWLQTNGEDSPYFADYNKQSFSANKPFGCGGGGSPSWSETLAFNHLGGSKGVRATFLYLKDENEIIYSTGCGNEIVERVSSDGKISNFDKNKIPAKSRSDTRHLNAPQELQLSADRSIIVGSLNGNVVLYNTKGDLVKTLTNSSKAYGPVFSHDGKAIFYADNFGDMPRLVRISTDGTNQKTIYQSKQFGAISNISSSPDSSQLIFTLIYQDQQSDVKNNITPEAKQDLYIMDSDGNNLKLFLNDAYQASWSPK